jgi:lipopolysaccharide biosynthesis glycosyltransferase
MSSKSNRKKLVYNKVSSDNIDMTSVENEKKISFPEISSPPINNNAYVWLLMKGDDYLPGVFVSIYSILRTNPDVDLVVMITEDVSDKAQNILLKVATHLFHIPYLSFKTNRLKTSKQDILYKNWKSVSYTKWVMLALPYQKTLFIDGDTIILANIDHLFDLPTPSAPFNNPFVKPLGKIPDFLDGKKGSDGYLLHGTCIPNSNIENIMKRNGMLLTASSVLLSPSLSDYHDYIKMVKSKEPYGSSTCHSMVDEQSIAEFYIRIKKFNWYNIHQRYNLIGWKDGFLSANDIPYILHYFSKDKPWSMTYNKWEDIISWYKMADESIKHTKIKASDIKLDIYNVQKAEKAKDTFIKKFTNNKNINSVLDVKDYI